MKLQIKMIFLLSGCLFLTGCFEGTMNTQKLCDSNPALHCEQLNMDDGQCRIQRTNLIWHRKESLESPTDANLIEEFELLNSYHQCLELATQIELSKADDVKESRFNALMHSINEEKRIITELNTHDSPEALYFLWTQGKQSAIRKYLKLEGTSIMNTAERQYSLATYYTSRDKEKTVNLLNNALELSNKSNLNINIFESLASVNHSMKRKEHAYVWVLVGKEFGVPVASERDLAVLYPFPEDKKQQLEQIAEDIIHAVEKENYTRAVISNIN